LLPSARVEFLLCDPGVVIPMVKHVYRRKSSTLDVLIRSGSLGREKLTELRQALASESYDLKVSFTSKHKFLSRIVVALPIEDGTISVTGVNVIRSIALVLGLPWPCRIAVGYALGAEDPHLPGRLVYREPYRAAGYQLGRAVAKLVKRVIS
jgi:hypothetical protein